MKFLYMVLQIAVLYAFYFVGTWLQNLLDLSIPGSILGMILLFLFLSLKIVPVKTIEKGAQFLNAYLPVFFIPATVGVMNYLHIFKGSGMTLIVITVLSTLIVMILAGKTSQYVSVRTHKHTGRMEE